MERSPQRLAPVMVERGLAESRSRARGMILAGAVRVGDEVATKAGFRAPSADAPSAHRGGRCVPRGGGAVAPKAGVRVPSDQALSVERGDRFVSRAGEKLDAALDEFGVDVQGRSCLDAGASTGGFTDVLLGRGAGRVISADVGYGQLAWSLREDPKVTVLERTNVRHLRGEDLPFTPDLLVADLSFISLAVAPNTLLSTTPLLREAVVLVKPQFEAGPKLVGRG